MVVLANFLGPVWRWLSPPPPQPDIADPLSAPPTMPQGQHLRPPSAKPVRKYDEIRTAVENRLNFLVRQEIPEHREIAKRDVLELHYIEIECVGPESETLLRSFFKDFNPTARQDWIRDILGGNAVVKLDYFAGVHSSGDMPDTGTIDKHEQMLGQGAKPSFSVHIWGQWVQGSNAAAQSPDKPSATRGQPVAFRIHDSKGQHPEVCKDTYPLTIGRGGGCSVVVTGTFVSGVHCVLYADHGRRWLEDHSKNGTWLDGKKIHSRQRVELTSNRHRVRLGKASGDAKDSPEMELELLEHALTLVAGATPIDSSNATPVIASPVGKLLAVLSIQDATGNPMYDVLHLPFTIGRAPDRDYTAPPTHAGVSGKHLTLEAITDQGVRVLNEAHIKNGTSLGDVLQAAEFLWPFDTEIVLAPKWRQDPSIRITLKRPR